MAQPVAPQEPVMFVMPEEYRHGASGKKMALPVAPVKPVAPTAPPKPVLPPKPVVPKKPMRKQKKMLIIGSILFIFLSIGGTGYALWSGMQSKETVKEKDVIEAQKAKEEAAAVAAAKKAEEKKIVADEVAAKKAEAEKNPFPTASTPGTDSDSDGLTDLEEKLVYSTNAKLPDTDSDGFLDGNEVFHRYNPGGTAPGTLFESGLVKLFETEVYTILYPSIWSVKDGIIFATTGESVVVTIENTDKLPFQEWFDTQKFAKSFDSAKTKNGYITYVQDDGLTELVEVGDGTIIQLRYDTGIKGTIDYLQTFKMIVNSLVAL